mmetsp:Transcript_120397/g.209588  ORF Transcript_120397/g.209588 Transcript_120397/m.209588 type:complete len:97 (+) Transcript_120397:792-1082(+)
MRMILRGAIQMTLVVGQWSRGDNATPDHAAAERGGLCERWGSPTFGISYHRKSRMTPRRMNLLMKITIGKIVSNFRPYHLPALPSSFPPSSPRKNP